MSTQFNDRGLSLHVRGCVGAFYCEIYEPGKRLPLDRLGPFRIERQAEEAGRRRAESLG